MRRVNSQSNCNSKCCCRGCLDNLRICLLADGSTCPCRPLRGGLPSLPPACPAFSLRCRPHPPARARRALSPSPLGKGLGDRGQGSKLKAGLASDKKDTPPVGHHSGKVSRRPTGQAPPAPERQGKPSSKKAPPPHFFAFSPCQRRADVIQYAIETETV